MDAKSTLKSVNLTITSPQSFLSLGVRELNDLLKSHGLKVGGKKQFKIARLCEVYGFSSEPGSFQSVLASVRGTRSGWIKDIRKAPQIELCQVSSYLLKAHKTTTHIKSDDIEIFTPQNLRR